MQPLRNGETKIRGIEARRHDTPAWIKAVQIELIEHLATTQSRRDMATALPQLMQIITRGLDRLRAGQVPLHVLTITTSLSRSAF